MLFVFFFAGKEARVWVIPVLLTAGLGLLIVVVVLVRKLKCEKGNCLIIIHEICFPELHKACTRAVPGSCVALQGTCLSSSSFCM